MGVLFKFIEASFTAYVQKNRGMLGVGGIILDNSSLAAEPNVPECSSYVLFNEERMHAADQGKKGLICRLWKSVPV